MAEAAPVAEAALAIDGKPVGADSDLDGLPVADPAGEDRLGQRRFRIGAERGWPPLTPADFEREIEHGSLYVGSPETVARKIVATVKALALARVDDPYFRAFRQRCMQWVSGEDPRRTADG